MKVTSAAVATSLNVSPDHILKHPEMKSVYRPIDATWVQKLAEDIKQRGLLAPIITFSPDADTKVKLGGKGENIPAHYLAAGAHRLEALKSLRKSDKAVYDKLFADGVPVRHFIGDVKQMMFTLLRENLHRREMQAEEIIPVLEKLRDEHKMSQKDIAAHLGMSTAWVNQQMAVSEELDNDTKEEVISGKIDLADARKLAQDVRKDRKEGKTVEKEHIREKASKLREKVAAKKNAGAERAVGDDRKIGAKKIWERVKALRKLPLSRENEVLKGALSYIAGEADKLPAELRKDAEKPVEKKSDEKSAKKAKK